MDSLNLNGDRSSTYTGNWTISLGAGPDTINSAKLKNGDSIDMGAGDDTLAMMTGGSNGTPAIGSASFAKLDGGAGTDTIKWDESITADGATLTLSTDGAVNFENLIGSNYAETITGDANANVLTGLGGADTINGLAGNDTLIADDTTDDGNRTTNDLLYGGAGDDALYGSRGNNTLDGGTGKDTITSHEGSDTIVIRSGDGSTNIANADVLTDFSNGNDVIGLDSITFDSLTIAQGSGDYSAHTLVSLTSSGEYLLIIQNQSVSNITAIDFASTSTDNQTLSGDANNNTLIGGAGNDTFNGNAGNDTLYGWGGNDTFNVTNKSGTYSEIVNGGAGTDSLSISYSGISSLSDFTMSYVGDSAATFTLTDSNGGVINFTGIENLTVNSIAYSLTEGDLSGTNITNIFWDGANDTTIHGFGSLTDTGAYFSRFNIMNFNSLTGMSGSDGFTYYGSTHVDNLNLNGDRSSTYTGNWTISLGADPDTINSAKLKNGDSIDMGAGDDTLAMMTGGGNGTPAIGSASFAKLDGGAGTDTIKWDESITADGATLTLSTDGAVNFENLIGSNYAETITGDANANVLTGF